MAEIPVGLQVIKNKNWESYAFYKKFTGRKPDDKIQSAFLTEKKTKNNWGEDISIWIRGNLFIPDARKFWIKPSVKLLSTFIKSENVDAMITTGPPHSTHLIGMKLHKQFNIPWLADFRDPWTNIDYYHDLKLSRRADRIHHQLEKQVLFQADAITVVSPGMKREFVTIVNRDVHVIPNGYDQEDITQGVKKQNVTDKFILAHIGSLNKDRNAENLWYVLNELVHEDEDFANKLEIRNVGKIDFSAVDSIRKYRMEKYLNRIEYLPHHKVISEQQNATVLLLLVNNTPNAKLILTGKLFEYLASKRPIVCIGPPDGDAANIIDETKCGKAFNFDDKSGLKTEILRLFQDFLKGVKRRNCNNVEQYERKNLTRKMAGVLDDLMANTSKTR